MEQKLSDTLVKAIDRSNPFMQNLQLASRFNKLVEESGDLEDNHEVTITENGETAITPAEGKNGMKKVTATVNVTHRILPVLLKVPASNSNANYYGFIGAENSVFSKASYTVEEAMELFENTYIMVNMSSGYYYTTLLDFTRQKLGDDWSVDNVEIGSSSSSTSKSIEFYGTEDKLASKAITLSIRKSSNVLEEPFVFDQWTDYGVE